MIKVIKDIFARTIRERLPKLENTLTAQYDLSLIGDDERIIMLAGVAKDPLEARRLMLSYGATNALELLKVLPKRQVNWRRRLRSWVQSLEGSSSSDPYRELLWPDGSGSNYLN